MSADPKRIGARLRDERLKRRMTVEDVAEAFRDTATERERRRLPALKNVARSIRGHESGEHPPGPRYQLRYAAVFGIPVGELFPESPVDRRGGPPDNGHVPQIVAGLNGALFAPARTPPEPRPAAEDLDRRAVLAWELRQSAEYVALGELLENLLLDTRDALEHAEGDQQRLNSMGAYVHANNSASSLLKWMAPELAAVAADRALQAARLIGDEALTGAAILRLANVFLAARRYRQAIDTASDGATALAPLIASTPAIAATWGALLLTAAVGAALLDEGPAPAWEFLGQAKVAATLLGREHAGLHAVFGPANLAIHGVQVATELGDPYEALRRAEHVDIGQLPAALAERRSTLLVDVARSHQLVGDHSSALGSLLEAESVAPQEIRYSSVANELVAELLHSPGGTDADLRALVERMNTST